MLTTMALAVACVVTTPMLAAATPVAQPGPIRAMQPRVGKLLATGMERSASFRRLVDRIEQSDLIVYVEARRDLRDGLGASMRFLSRSATHRFVHIRLNAALGPATLVALLGHELQHVVEVADNPGVQSADDMRAFYRREGVRTGDDSYDTEAARAMGYLVRAEMLRGRGDLRMARDARGEEAEARVLETASIAGARDSAPGS